MCATRHQIHIKLLSFGWKVDILKWSATRHCIRNSLYKNMIFFLLVAVTIEGGILFITMQRMKASLAQCTSWKQWESALTSAVTKTLSELAFTIFALLRESWKQEMRFATKETQVL